MRFILFLTLLVSCKNSRDAFLPCPEKDFWWAVMMAESGGDPRKKFTESDGTISAGLYQLSVSDGVRYGCRFKTIEDVLDPVKNTECKDLIAAKLKNTRTGTYGIVLGSYWGTLRQRSEWPEYFVKYPSHSGFEHFKFYARTRGCNL